MAKLTSFKLDGFPLLEIHCRFISGLMLFIVLGSGKGVGKVKSVADRVTKSFVLKDRNVDYMNQIPQW